MRHRIVLDNKGVKKAVSEITDYIAVFHADRPFAVIGIRSGGAFLASRITSRLKRKLKRDIELGILDITLYRDDLVEIGPRPEVKETDISFDVDGKLIFFIDDVLFTGRTIRCALDQIIDFGRPAEVKLAVLVDRGGRQLPICPDYAGIRVEPETECDVDVRLREAGYACDSVVVRKRKNETE